MNLRHSVKSLFLAAAFLAAPLVSEAGVFVSITIAPPMLPVYAQPICPGDGYLWTPGYWAWGPVGYYWVPGTWVLAPRPGFLWTPGYWGFGSGIYVWHAGYWGPHVGFYGGVNYGFGYTGIGFAGGFWSGGHFNYNRSVTNVNVTNVHNVYNKTVINNRVVNRSSFNGPGGMSARPTQQEMMAQREQHVSATPAQVRRANMASNNRALLASVNHGHPAQPAMNRAYAAAHGGNGGMQANQENFNRPQNNRPAYNASQRSAPNGYTQPKSERPQAEHEHPNRSHPAPHENDGRERR